MAAGSAIGWSSTRMRVLTPGVVNKKRNSENHPCGIRLKPKKNELPDKFHFCPDKSSLSAIPAMFLRSPDSQNLGF
ncbi:predicted protein [Uncinocarpus reesii 1704]|uniref:Uncharacterized protein n=1 Tax=Uncinocarpus reesii (strain UAMH 1704) TaxID=336963 RepID=C4JU42_UNCRE|nr:uncharacterized protein UREG_05981 [Uncinocarpus reesii 1704]EEP81139.1 predicted protein [Uncinocarpus reesii 1704]